MAPLGKDVDPDAFRDDMETEVIYTFDSAVDLQSRLNHATEYWLTQNDAPTI